MNSQQQLVAIHTSFWLVLLLTPLAVLFWRRPKGVAQISWLRFLLSILSGWLLLNLHRLFIELPVLLALQQDRGNVDYDGVGGNAATLVFIWIPVLVVTGVYSLVALLWWRFQKRHA